MTDRRAFICFCCATAPWSSFAYDPTNPPKKDPEQPLGSMPQASTSPNNIGRVKYKATLACSLSASSGTSSSSLKMLDNSGDSQFDVFFAAEVRYLSNFFQLTPVVGYFDEGDIKMANAFATHPQFGGGGNENGLIGMGLQLKRRIEMEFGGMGPMAYFIYTSVMAHEFGHITQFMAAIQGAHTGVLKGGKYPELHGDIIAGAYIASRQAGLQMMGQNIGPAAMGVLRKFYSIGDTDYTSRNHHGTPQERYTAAAAGYQFASQLISQGRSIPPLQLYQLAAQFVGY